MVAVAILAAGKGTRMKSQLPKVLHRLGSQTLLDRVLASLTPLNVDRCFVIVGYQGDRVRESWAHRTDIEFVEQTQQLGTGHAVQQLLPHLKGYQGDLLVLNGDVPLLRGETLEALVSGHQRSGAAATLLTAQLNQPKGYGRVFCDATSRVCEIIEDRDCTPAQRQNPRVNAGVYCFRWPDLEAVLPNLSTANDQQEYYLTEAITYLDPVSAVEVADSQEILGINDRLQLADSFRILQERIRQQWMLAGVTLVDPTSITIDETVQLGTDVVIEPQTHLRGNTVIGNNCSIGPNSLITNSQIGDGVTVQMSVISDSTIAANSKIGPFAHLRGAAAIGEACRIGNFVEVKKSTVGDRTNVAHLSYLGDATLGQRVNVGAGTITANYDGVSKHPTVIGDRSKTGANSVLVAPVTIGQDVTIAAGSTINKDVPDGALAIARSRQTIHENWSTPTTEQ
ncbi:bifunctional UDP-N-acetylglucosamine diphosphorylase/glucosamine-1-phosphate N-acetyltransferase GlmU [Synechococcus elongatus]|uniref:Bifunctional protein GlmU n=2 Tax=Synechococcus elongatus TaxID=32046 RepID=GLMU_SYNE7|nr:bifunctional UDP-N-acetylglucosamine diphosphorylase/glucosamine-1-phosphate N-acetyltransferase GlmU [Synechococcus elongatus]Q31RJ9.1 RecName: Full=Bifunctional protein GlmU; Includes: RecName: Full=UDP-N-acetylglucosamine pyrophosphorylase; AltName: Full=N-acetylglucosamine-1-phosphate uridyltransferase; Includes: RecName: Full=Glucosamine-1-phosphate N-acetyltransferase [Synechococcus elongatus PCC 7942 = FACHB-805]Q5N2Q6.1 RecName: Full=Bifunctional protein GlmU; Includes: RecName: Full=U